MFEKQNIERSPQKKDVEHISIPNVSQGHISIPKLLLAGSAKVFPDLMYICNKRSKNNLIHFSERRTLRLFLPAQIEQIPIVFLRCRNMMKPRTDGKPRDTVARRTHGSNGVHCLHGTQVSFRDTGSKNNLLLVDEEGPAVYK
jgi:hypothetical protein